MSGCGSNIDTRCAGAKTNARCTKYEGTYPTNSTIPVNDRPCASVEDVVQDIYGITAALTQAVDLSGLSETCFNYNNNSNPVKVSEAILKIHEKLLQIMEAIGMPCENGSQPQTICNPIFDQSISCLNLQLGSIHPTCNTPIANFRDLLQAFADAINSKVNI